MGDAEARGEHDRRGGLLTDLYELNMAAIYLRRGVMSIFMAVGTAGYTHSLAAAHR